MVLLSIIAAMSFADLGIGNGLMNAISEAYGKDDRKLAREYVTSAELSLIPSCPGPECSM
jgi:O-antigen/teichoic acid export membrane protein